MFFVFNDTATTEIYTLSLHDALPISSFARSLNNGLSSGFWSANFLYSAASPKAFRRGRWRLKVWTGWFQWSWARRSEEHTSELQSRQYLVCRLLLEKKKNGRSVIDRV